MSHDPSDDEALLANLTILLVEDDPSNRLLMADLLEVQGGARVTTATTVREALEAIVQLKPDILISNIVLPDGDGYALIQQVRSLPPEQGGETPAIAVTASVTEENRVGLLPAGFQAYFFKPFDFDELMQKIVELVVVAP